MKLGKTANMFGKTAAKLSKNADSTSTAARDISCGTSEVITTILHIFPSRPKAGVKPQGDNRTQ